MIFVQVPGALRRVGASRELSPMVVQKSPKYDALGGVAGPATLGKQWVRAFISSGDQRHQIGWRELEF